MADDGIRVSGGNGDGEETTKWERSRAGLLRGRLRHYRVTIQGCSSEAGGSNSKFYRAKVSDALDGYVVLMSSAYSTEEEAKAGAENFIARYGIGGRRSR